MCVILIFLQGAHGVLGETNLTSPPLIDKATIFAEYSEN